MVEMVLPSAFPAISLLAIPMTLPISFIPWAPVLARFHRLFVQFLAEIVDPVKIGRSPLLGPPQGQQDHRDFVL